jgi:hypothetical protein
MLTVENLLSGLNDLVLTGHEKDPWKSNFIMNVHDTVAYGGRALSTAQSQVILKLANQHASHLVKVLGKQVAEIQQAISNPAYQRPVWQSQNIPREVRYLGGNKIAFRFKLDQTVVVDLKALKNRNNKERPYFNKKCRVWVASVTSGNVEAIQSLIKRHKFAYDHAVLEYFMKVTQQRDKVPTVTYDNETGNLRVTIPNNVFLAQMVEATMGGEAV